MNIKIYTLPKCTYCTMLKEYLDEHNIHYDIIDMSPIGDPVIQEYKKLFKVKGLKAYPVTEINVENSTTYLYGFNESVKESIMKYHVESKY